MKGVLVTGATGFIGSRLVKAYLDRDGYRVFTLARAPSARRAEQRMRDVLGFWGVPEATLRERVVVVRGDVAEPALGLDPELRAAVADEVALVVHAASPIRLDLPLEEARKQILSSTEHAFEVFRSCRQPERFGFVSTLEVCGDYTDTVYEEFLTDYRRGFLNSYEIAKAEAEEMLRGRIDEGWGVTVFRPGMVVGESATGRALRFQTFYLILERMLLQPLLPVMPSGCQIDTIPVDVLAEGMVELMEQEAAAGRVFHLSQGVDDLVSFGDFLDQVQPLAEAQLGRPIRRPRYVSPNAFSFPIRALRPIASQRLRRALRSIQIFIPYFHYHWRFDTRQARQALTDSGVHWPGFSEYLPKLVDYYFAHRQENRLPF